MLSIIIPTLNEEDYLPLLLESIKRQDRHNPGDYEIIVADAESKDKTVEIAKSYGCKIAKGGLPAKGRNEGAKLAKGDLFLFVDADVILPENFLEKILKEFKKRKLDIATCQFASIANKKREELVYRFFYNIPIKISESFLAYASQIILAKKILHQKLGGFNEEVKIGEDHYYGRKGAKIGKFGVLKSSKILVSPRRFHQEGWVRTYSKYLLVWLHMLFFGPVKSNIVRYKFGHYNKPEFDISNEVRYNKPEFDISNEVRYSEQDARYNGRTTRYHSFKKLKKQP